MPFPSIDPIAFEIGPLKVHWYGIAYLVGFLSALWLARYRSAQLASKLKKNQVLDLVVYASLGAIIGGRIGYTLFYGFDQFAANPLSMFKIWEGGMSFHGGLVGCISGIWFYAYRSNTKFLELTDFLAPFAAVGLFVGRIANFINQELWGRATDLSWGIVFPNDPEALPRHPSQLYEAALEGIVLFIVIWIYSSKPRVTGTVSGLFLTLYGSFRLTVEFVREPDSHIGFVLLNWMTMGQLLSIPLVVFGLYLWLRMSLPIKKSDPNPAA